MLYSFDLSDYIFPKKIKNYINLIFIKINYFNIFKL